MNAADIRDLFRDFFVARGHLAGEPASLVPAGDASVLFTTAGMQQYKPYYLGVETPPATRITTCQRCFRTSDIENVGKTARHLTFFEMLGNFSFGDYFKKPTPSRGRSSSRTSSASTASKVWVSVFGGDDAGAGRRRGRRAVEVARLPRRAHRPSRPQDNFWGPAGPTGPCGPCSELYYDIGPGDGLRRPGLRAGLRLRPLHGVLEPRLRAVRHGRGRRPDAAAQAAASTPAWASSASPPSRRASTNVFETDLFAPLVAHGRGAGRRAARGVAGRHPRPAHHGRARPRRRLPRHGRRAARQRGARLRAAPHHPPRRAAGREHRRREAVPRDARRTASSS